MSSRLHAFNLSQEISSLLFELKLFEEQYLPLLLAPRALDYARLVSRSHREGDPASCHCHCSFGLRLANWRQAVVHLRQAFVQGLRRPHVSLVLAEFEELYANSYPPYPGILGRPEDTLFSLGDWKICWHVYPYSGREPKDRQHQARRALACSGYDAGDRADAWEELQRRLPEIEEWYLRLPPLGDEHLMACQWLLPILADSDPAFPAKALDRRRMRALVLHDNEASSPEKTAIVRTLHSQFFSTCFCYCLALVMETLANNHFCAIRRLLVLPEVYGNAFWTGLMPKIILAVLLRKAEVLCQLARAEGK